MKILSWNVNGVRAAEKKGFFNWFQKESPEILCLQEIKATPDQLPPYLRNIPGYHIFWNSAEKKGYSGVATFTKQKSIDVETGFGKHEFDKEGRILINTFPSFTLFNIYFPNGKKNQERLQYKLDFYDEILIYIDKLKAKKRNIIVCGDFNTAHKEIDLARPKENEHISGFLPIERAWIDSLVNHGYVDTFRHYHKEANQFTWWDLKTGARARNVGWRIDYFFVNKEFLTKIKSAFILQQVIGSDHCPIGIDIIG